MNINTIHNNLNFGQLVPTEPLLKSALEIHNFQEGKLLSLSVDKSFPGHVGYFNKAIKIAKQIQGKNNFVSDIIAKLAKLPKEEQLKNILSIRQKIGNEIDVII